MDVWSLWELVSQVNDMYYGVDKSEIVFVEEDEELAISNYWSILKVD